MKNNWLGSNFFYFWIFFFFSSHKSMLFLLDMCLEGITDVDTDLKVRIVSFKVTPSNDRVLSFYAPSGYNTREQLV